MRERLVKTGLQARGDGRVRDGKGTEISGWKRLVIMSGRAGLLMQQAVAHKPQAAKIILRPGYIMPYAVAPKLHPVRVLAWHYPGLICDLLPCLFPVPPQL